MTWQGECSQYVIQILILRKINGMNFTAQPIGTFYISRFLCLELLCLYKSVFVQVWVKQAYWTTLKCNLYEFYIIAEYNVQ